MAKQSRTRAGRDVSRPAEDRPSLFSLHREIDKLFDDFMGGLPSPFTGGRSAWEGSFPSWDISETEKAVEVKAELPGISPDDVEISVSDDVLTISGEKKFEKEESDKDKHYHRVERSYGSFRRSLSLPADVDVNKIKAEAKDGILNITLPKTKQAQSNVKKIRVQSR